mmetsp:Transcript_13224/g.22435  ORF Transcript_13224/g.22435 Transcript_13224/m.22435 type:complete len:158 (+) Transcript_13224:345-818(+)
MQQGLKSAKDQADVKINEAEEDHRRKREEYEACIQKMLQQEEQERLRRIQQEQSQALSARKFSNQHSHHQNAGFVLPISSKSNGPGCFSGAIKVPNSSQSTHRRQAQQQPSNSFNPQQRSLHSGNPSLAKHSSHNKPLNHPVSSDQNKALPGSSKTN